MQNIIVTKRIYEPPDTEDGYRILVDRVWPRGVSKEIAHLNEWVKEIAPTTELRKWYNHELPKWEEFKKKYFAELDANPVLKDFVQLCLGHKKTTFLYSAKDEQHNQAIALQQYMNKVLKK